MFEGHSIFSIFDSDGKFHKYIESFLASQKFSDDIDSQGNPV